ncbi:hypothetical protein C0Q70_05562 [Pomacea canaliculata]|uniref:F-box domain-containing protein n=1 Tax=Pomacea canaliculata TaxID=400727 RepID=A0A2T7PLI5_POMCA|nr:hypothetical protein C0Q70_05562 [Pomacea canaliculata]
MDTLPSELLCNILSNLDGRSLLAAASVCCKWQTVIQTISANSNIWFVCCLREININTLVALTGRTELVISNGIYKTKQAKDEWQYWKNIYLQYYRYTILVINAYQQDPTDLEFRLLPLHSHSVSDVGLVRPGGSGNHENRILIITVDLAGYVNLCSFDGVPKAQLRVSSKHIKGVSTFGKYFTVGMHASMVPGVQVFKVEWQGVHLKIDIIMRLSGLLYSDINAVVLSHDKLAAGDQQGVLYLWNLPSLVGSDQNPSTVKMEDPCVRNPIQCLQMEASVSQIVACQDSYVILLSNRTLIVLRPDGKLLRISVDALGSSAGVQAEPICIATNGPVLGVGCQHGIVLLFNTHEDKWWTNLRGSLMYTLRTHVNHVVSLAITYNGARTIVIAGGNHAEVYCW